jgi:hypothetical protein
MRFVLEIKSVGILFCILSSMFVMVNQQQLTTTTTNLIIYVLEPYKVNLIFSQSFFLKLFVSIFDGDKVPLKKDFTAIRARIIFLLSCLPSCSCSKLVPCLRKHFLYLINKATVLYYWYGVSVSISSYLIGREPIIRYTNDIDSLLMIASFVYTLYTYIVEKEELY